MAVAATGLDQLPMLGDPPVLSDLRCHAGIGDGWVRSSSLVGSTYRTNPSHTKDIPIAACCATFDSVEYRHVIANAPVSRNISPMGQGCMIYTPTLGRFVSVKLRMPVGDPRKLWPASATPRLGSTTSDTTTTCIIKPSRPHWHRDPSFDCLSSSNGQLAWHSGFDSYGRHIHPQSAGQNKRARVSTENPGRAGTRSIIRE